jgi:hypothetical protein
MTMWLGEGNKKTEGGVPENRKMREPMKFVLPWCSWEMKISF